MGELRWLFVLLAIFIGACSTLSKDECITADWKTIGFEDGSRGYTSQRISSHRESCAEHGVSPNMDRYLLGHRAGLKNYCTHSNGLKLGKRGSQYNQVCPKDLEGQFIAGYRQGKKIYSVSSQLSELEDERQRIIQEIENLTTERDKKREMVIAQSTGPTLRRELLNQIKVLEESIVGRNDSLDHLEHKITRYRLRLEKLNSILPN
ncbi:MAG: DUF2799 domain-containing protein [Pseudomonadales bacterium]|nr:DUF2799 domain-containing protein [Pseudomonadales bacterium]